MFVCDMARTLLLLIGLVLMTTKLSGGGQTDAPSTRPADYPIVNTIKTNMSAKNRPSWSDVTSAAVLKGVNSGHFDRHYHDCNEYWLIAKGKAKVWIDGHTYYVKDGDIVCLKKGLEHDILELYEPLIGFHFEDATPPGGRTGHLHKNDEAAKGHDVPTLPLPPDFPKD
jgi:mannose-6-phosphate isomerase-like protein (cupin superfamily)